MVNDGAKYATVYLPRYGFTLPLYYDQHEIQLKAKVECVYEKGSEEKQGPAAEQSTTTSATGRRAQFSKTKKQKDQQNLGSGSGGGGSGSPDAPEQKILKHIVTTHDGVAVDVAPMGHVRVELKATPGDVGEYSILLAY